MSTTAEIEPKQAASPDTRPGLAIIANCMNPYRLNLHRLLAAGIPELKLHSLITHGPAEFDWSMTLPKEIHTSHFGGVDDSPLAGTLHAPLREWHKGGRLIRYLHEHNIRAVICNGYRYLSYQRVMHHCHRAGIPVFSNNDSNIKSEAKLPAWKLAAKRLVYATWIKQVAGIMSMGEYGDQFFLKYGATPKQIYRVTYTPDYDYFADIDAEHLQRFRTRHQLRADRKYIMFSGRLVPVKRVDLLIDAFCEIADQRPDWDVLIVGDGYLHDALRGRIPTLCRERFLWAGFLDRDDLVAAYHASSMLVLPSDLEPWALVVQEAMAAGRPVIASDAVGAARELVENGISGRIFPVGDRKALSAAILDVSDANKLAVYQRHAVSRLAHWRRHTDPVAEVRRALVDAGVLI